MVKKTKKSAIGICKNCGACSWCVWLMPLIILMVAAIPTWYATTWARWLIMIIAALLILKRLCPSCCKK